MYKQPSDERDYVLFIFSFAVVVAFQQPLESSGSFSRQHDVHVSISSHRRLHVARTNIQADIYSKPPIGYAGIEYIRLRTTEASCVCLCVCACCVFFYSFVFPFSILQLTPGYIHRCPTCTRTPSAARIRPFLVMQTTCCAALQPVRPRHQPQPRLGRPCWTW